MTTLQSDNGTARRRSCGPGASSPTGSPPPRSRSRRRSPCPEGVGRGEQASAEATGDLTIHGVTNEVTLDLDVELADGRGRGGRPGAGRAHRLRHRGPHRLLGAVDRATTARSSSRSSSPGPEHQWTVRRPRLPVAPTGVGWTEPPSRWAAPLARPRRCTTMSAWLPTADPRDTARRRPRPVGGVVRCRPALAATFVRAPLAADLARLPVLVVAAPLALAAFLTLPSRCCWRLLSSCSSASRCWLSLRAGRPAVRGGAPGAGSHAARRDGRGAPPPAATATGPVAVAAGIVRRPRRLAGHRLHRGGLPGGGASARYVVVVATAMASLLMRPIPCWWQLVDPTNTDAHGVSTTRACSSASSTSTRGPGRSPSRRWAWPRCSSVPWIAAVAYRRRPAAGPWPAGPDPAVRAGRGPRGHPRPRRRRLGRHLRRIERDLHDGTQARLVALAMHLDMAKDALAAGRRGRERRPTSSVPASCSTRRTATPPRRSPSCARSPGRSTRRRSTGASTRRSTTLAARSGVPAEVDDPPGEPPLARHRDDRLLLRRRAAREHRQAQRRPAGVPSTSTATSGRLRRAGRRRRPVAVPAWSPAAGWRGWPSGCARSTGAARCRARRAGRPWRSSSCRSACDAWRGCAS